MNYNNIYNNPIITVHEKDNSTYINVCVECRPCACAGRRCSHNGGKLKAYQIAFLTKKLNLTPEEAQRFWPVFNKYEDEIRTTRQQNKQSTEVELEEKVVNIRKKYFEEFSKVLNRTGQTGFLRPIKNLKTV